MTTLNNQVPVTQADREAAADYIKADERDVFGHCFAIREGLNDSDNVVQAFAAHRIDALDGLNPEAVADVVEALRSAIALSEGLWATLGASGAADDLIAELYPDSRRRDGQTKDHYAKAIRRQLNEAKIQIAMFNATLARLEAQS